MDKIFKITLNREVVLEYQTEVIIGNSEYADLHPTATKEEILELAEDFVAEQEGQMNIDWGYKIEKIEEIEEKENNANKNF